MQHQIEPVQVQCCAFVSQGTWSDIGVHGRQEDLVAESLS